MAGGQATRLGSSLPKGVMPFSPVDHKSLLQLIAEKVLAYAARHQHEPYLAIMVSEATEAETKKLFLRHSNFGLPRVWFFTQPSLPLCSRTDGSPIRGEDGAVVTGPNGNGVVFHELVRSRTLEEWECCGVAIITLVQVDNPLCDPFYYGLCAAVVEGHDLAVAAIRRTSISEQVGVFVQAQGKTLVVEYSELPPELDPALFCWANISQFACAPPFVRHVAKQTLPKHVARKSVGGKEVCKTEFFIFDCMEYSTSTCLVELPRDRYFSPVKDPASFIEAQRRFLEC